MSYLTGTARYGMDGFVLDGCPTERTHCAEIGRDGRDRGSEEARQALPGYWDESVSRIGPGVSE
ncbi:hypothetical protein [Streptomyces ochraceiscleroticus]|uniref:Uncharacterized protein n=1 Tax=Streptomyces ochraceiscleroticus TaxID=47761 RepID=A0ABW1MB68_9ACTN|nr:hypothetical protein [Streptomyces ochraceiscleroticus]